MRHKSSHNHRGRPQKAPNHDGRKGVIPRIAANLFGFHAVSEAWINPQRHFHALYMTETTRAEFEPFLKDAQAAGLRRPPIQIVNKDVIDRALPRDTVHQGIAADTEPLEEIDLSDVMREIDQAGKGLLLMLDQVTDPHNVGAIMRSACAFGVKGIVMQSMNAPEIGGIIAKTACGAAEHIPLLYETNLTRAMDALKRDGFFIYGLDERGEVDIAKLNPAPKSVIVLGAEGAGLRRLLKENCDQLVSLPTTGRIKSLNVSNAAAVAVFAAIQKL